MARDKDRLAKQRDYQRRYRAMKRAAREPDRDEIARELLHFVITRSLGRGQEAELWELASIVLDRLAERGYERKAADRVFHDIVERYEAGWSFQRRVHLFREEGAVRSVPDDDDHWNGEVG